ncbi:phosphopantothenoylcysteine decarboxylase, partial [Allisonella histaminiformans]
PDILLGLGERKQNQVLVGFAAETNDVIAHGREKLVRKNLDLLVANDVSSPESGFHVDENQVSLLTPDGHVSSYPRMAKEDIGTLIIEKIASIMK